MILSENNETMFVDLNKRLGNNLNLAQIIDAPYSITASNILYILRKLPLNYTFSKL